MHEHKMDINRRLLELFSLTFKIIVLVLFIGILNSNVESEPFLPPEIKNLVIQSEGRIDLSDAKRNKMSESPIIWIYRITIDNFWPGECPMYPTCSRFAEGVIRNRRNDVELLLIIDRLLRCGHDLSHYKTKKHGYIVKYIDFPKSYLQE